MTAFQLIAGTSLAFFVTMTVTTPGFAQDSTIVDIASSDANLSSLVDAVASEDLVETLSGGGPFTVFAPTNSAFSQIPKVVTEAIELDDTLLKDILLAHVVAGDVRAEDVVRLRSAQTVGGNDIPIRVFDGTVFIGSSKVTQTDIVASNGVIHVVDKVIVPREVMRRAYNTMMRSRLGRLNARISPSARFTSTQPMNATTKKPCDHGGSY